MSAITVKKLHTLTGHRDCVYALQPSSDPNVFFSGAGDGMVVKWDLANPDTGEVIAKLPNSVYAMHYHADSDTLIAGHNYDGIHILDWKNKKEIGSLQISGSAIFDIQSFGNVGVVACGDGGIYVIDLKRLAIVSRLQHSDKSARCVAIDAVGKKIAVGYSDNFIRVFDEQFNLQHEWEAHANSVFTLRFIPGGSMLLSGSRDARFKVWDGADSWVETEAVVAHMYAINHVDFSPDGKHFVTCSMDKSIKVWDRDGMKLLKVIDRARHAGHGTSVNKVLWTSYKDQVLSASDDRTISVWHIIF